MLAHKKQKNNLVVPKVKHRQITQILFLIRVTSNNEIVEVNKLKKNIKK